MKEPGEKRDKGEETGILIGKKMLPRRLEKK